MAVLPCFPFLHGFENSGDRWVAYQERRLAVPHTDVEAPATPGIQDPCGIRKIILVPSLTGLG
jgi:hypothetical protein